MIVGGQRFPETPAGYRYASRHVYKLGPAFHDDAYSLGRHASLLEIEARGKRRIAITLAVGLVAMVAWALWNTV